MKENQCGFCGAEFPSLKDFMESRQREDRPSFQPGWFWNEAGQMIEVYWKNDHCYETQLNNKVSLLRSFETDEIVGCKVYGVIPEVYTTIRSPK